MNKEIIGRVWVNDRLEHYANFFDHEWSRQTLAIAEPIEKLRPIYTDLCTAWKGTARNAHMPWANIYSFKSFAEGFQRYKDHLGDVKKLALVMGRALVKELPGVSPLTLQMAIAKVVEDVSTERIDTLEGTFSAEEAWTQLFEGGKTGDFQLTLAWCQRLSFTNLYFAYEDFIRQCIAAKVGDPEFDCGDIKGLRKQMSKHFTEQLMESCLNSYEINAARCVRNALAHHGGRNIKQAVDSNHTHEVVDDVIQITALDNRDIFNVMKVKVSELVAHIATMPEFQN